MLQPKYNSYIILQCMKAYLCVLHHASPWDNSMLLQSAEEKYNYKFRKTGLNVIIIAGKVI